MTGKVSTRFAAAGGALGGFAAMMAMTTGPALGATASGGDDPARGKSRPHRAQQLQPDAGDLAGASGTWLITGKMWADSVITGSTRNAVVGCPIFNGNTFLDNSACNTPKVGGPGGGRERGERSGQAVRYLHHQLYVQ